MKLTHLPIQISKRNLFCGIPTTIRGHPLPSFRVDELMMMGFNPNPDLLYTESLAHFSYKAIRSLIEFDQNLLNLFKTDSVCIALKQHLKNNYFPIRDIINIGLYCLPPDAFIDHPRPLDVLNNVSINMAKYMIAYWQSCED